MPASGAEPGEVEWIEEPLGRGVKAGVVRMFRAGCLLLAVIALVVGVGAFAAGWAEIVVWSMLGATAVLFGLGLRLAPAELPDRLGLAKEEMVIVGPAGRERRVAYERIIGLSRADGATATARLRFRSGPGRLGRVGELLLDREVAERVLARAASR